MAWVRAAGLQELRPGRAKGLNLEGRRIALFNVDGAFRAMDDDCPHEEGGSLSRGNVEDGSVGCPLHGARFSLTTGETLEPPGGEPMGPPVDRGVRIYPVQVIGDEIFLEV